MECIIVDRASDFNKGANREVGKTCIYGLASRDCQKGLQEDEKHELSVWKAHKSLTFTNWLIFVVNLKTLVIFVIKFWFFSVYVALVVWHSWNSINVGIQYETRTVTYLFWGYDFSCKQSFLFFGPTRFSSCLLGPTFIQYILACWEEFITALYKNINNYNNFVKYIYLFI